MIHVSRKMPLPIEISLKIIRKTGKTVLKTMGIDGDLSIVFTNNFEIQQLNKDYRQFDSPTDVLSFPSNEIDPNTHIRYLGDVIISVEKALTQSQQAGRDIMDEITMLIVHGCLHLTGLDHSTKQEKEKMQYYQESILTSLGVRNPAWPEEV